MSADRRRTGATLLADARGRFEAGDMQEAVTLAREAASAGPPPFEALMLWGVAALEGGDPVAALAPLRRALARSPDGGRDDLLQLQFGRALIAVGRWREGLERLDGLLGARTLDPWKRHRLALGLMAASRVEAATPLLLEASSAAPGDAALQADLAWAFAAQGDADRAREHYERAIARAPLLGRAHAGLATLRRWTAHDHHVDRLRAALARSNDPGLRTELGYALFKELDDLGDHREAWLALSAAHAAAYGLAPWSADADFAMVDALIDRFRRPLAGERRSARGGGDGPRPIFVAGLPRSGTTLVERILGAHSRVTGLGELPFFPNMFRETAGANVLVPFTDSLVRQSRKADWRAAGAAYRREIAALAGGSDYVVDKLPFNSMLAGAIQLALPDATIVLVERDPMDVLWSAHRSPLQIGGWYGWARRQADLAAHHHAHRRLMAHWRAVLDPRGLLTVQYEDLVTDTQSAVASLLGDCGLPFEAACLRPQDDPSAILTLSQTSARRPIHTGAIRSWEAYARELEPLRQALERDGVA